MKKFAEILERAFRRGVVYPFLRVVFRNPVSNAKLDLQRVKRLLIFRFDRIGDVIVTTPILKALKRNHPQLRLGVLASASNAELLENCPYVDDLYVLQSNWIKLLRQVRQLRRQRYDVLLNFVFNRTTFPGILANLIAPAGYKVGQGPDRYAFYFNRLLKLPRFEQPMVTSLAVCLDQVFGIELNEEELEYEINVDDVARRAVDNWLAKHLFHRRSRSKPAMMPYVLFNLSVSDSERRISTDQAAALASHLSGKSGIRTVLLIAPDDREMAEAVQGRQGFQDCITYQTTGAMPLGQLASLVEGALAVISPDTSIIHFASAMRTPVLGIYTHSQGTNREWSPHHVRHELLIAPPGEPVSSIQQSALLEKADEFISSILRTGQQKSSEAL